MIPTYTDEEFNQIGGEGSEVQPTSYPVTGEDVTLNFETKDIVLADGLAGTRYGEKAIKQWVEKTLRTRAYQWDIYRRYAEREELEDDTETEEQPPDEDDSGAVAEEQGDATGEALYGNEILDYFYRDTSFAYKTAQIQKEIETCLAVHDDILDVGNFSFTRERRGLHIEFEVDTKYGVISEEVTI